MQIEPFSNLVHLQTDFGGDGVFLHWLPGFSATVTVIGVFRRSCTGFFAKVIFLHRLARVFCVGRPGFFATVGASFACLY